MVVRARRTGGRDARGVDRERIVANPRHVKDAGNVRDVGCVRDTEKRIVAKPRHVRDVGNVRDVGSVRDTESWNARGVRRGPQGGQTHRGKSQ
jgi:hypothetical protein